MSPAGLAFTRMTLPQQQQFIALVFGSRTGAQNGGLEELARAALNVDYVPSGWFEWRPPTRPGGPPSRWPVRARVRERTREAVLQAARRIDPQVDELQIIPAEWAASVRCMLGPPGRRYSTAGAEVSPHSEMYFGPSTQASAE